MTSNIHQTIKKNVLTLATGKQLYIELAINLARSFYLWNKDTGITFHIVTDNPTLIPKDVLVYSKIIGINRGELGEGFSTKLHLDKIAPDGQTLFIDSDCLIFSNLNTIFERFSGKSISVVGGFINKGEWFGDISSILKKFKLTRMPKFNGGIYYIDKGEKASSVYNTARELEKKYDEIGFVRLRNRPNDEVLMALAMEIHHQSPIVDDGTIMSDPQACPGGYDIDVISGKRWLHNPPAPNKQHQSWYPFENVEPIIVHFLGYYTQHYPYKREVYRLKQASNGDLTLIMEIKIRLIIEYPERIKNSLKLALRPLYKVFFGTRRITQSDRAV